MQKSQIISAVLSCVVLYAASLFCVPLKSTLAAQQNDWHSYPAVVTQIVESTTEYYEDEEDLKRVTIVFNAKITSGQYKGKIVPVVQVIDDFISLRADPVNEKSRIIVLQMYDAPQQIWENGFLQNNMQSYKDSPVFVFEEYHRTLPIIALGLIFVVLLLLFGGVKGIFTLVSLFLTCGAIIWIFIPSIFTGYNVYTSSILVCLYIIIMTLLIVNGANKKSLAAIIGCFSGVLVSALLSVIMSKIMHLNGYLNTNSLYLAALLPGGQSDLVAVIFAAIIIGSVGAVMDVAMSLSSALYELAESVEGITFSKLLKSGFTIGRDIMGTMANTLILAYIGSSLTFVLILIAYNSSFLALLNHQMIIVEMLQSLAGSLGILCGIPLTAFISALLYSVKITVSLAPSEEK